MTPIDDMYRLLETTYTRKTFLQVIIRAVTSTLTVIPYALWAPFNLAARITRPVIDLFRHLIQDWLIGEKQAYDFGATRSPRELASQFSKYRRFSIQRDSDMLVKTLERCVLDAVVDFLERQRIDTAGIRETRDGHIEQWRDYLRWHDKGREPGDRTGCNEPRPPHGRQSQGGTNCHRGVIPMSNGNDGIVISGGHIAAGALAIGKGARAVHQSVGPKPVEACSITESVFLSYRRSDAKAYAGRLRDALRPRFQPPAELFMDLNSIAGGDDFPDTIDKALAKSSVVLVLIGPSWLVSPGVDGQPRLGNPQDLVRHEVSTSLTLGRKVIPVLVDGASMPAEAQLPAVISALSRLNAVELSDSRWDYDLGKLLSAIAGR